MPDVDDSSLVERCLRGDTRAFEALVRCYQQPLYRLAFRITGDPDDALDLTQTAFLKAYENLGSYRPGSKFFSWVYRIALNEGINHSNRRRAGRTRDRDYAEQDPPSAGDGAAGEEHEWVQPALMGLTLEYRIAVILRHFLDLSYREMAEVMGVPEKTVKSRLFSARRLLRDYLLSQAPDVSRSHR